MSESSTPPMPPLRDKNDLRTWLEWFAQNAPELQGVDRSKINTVAAEVLNEASRVGLAAGGAHPLKDQRGVSANDVENVRSRGRKMKDVKNFVGQRLIKAARYYIDQHPELQSPRTPGTEVAEPAAPVVEPDAAPTLRLVTDLVEEPDAAATEAPAAPPVAEEPPVPPASTPVRPPAATQRPPQRVTLRPEEIAAEQDAASVAYILSQPATRLLLAREIRARREAAGLTRDELATRLGVGEWPIRSIETAHQHSTVIDIAALVDALGWDGGMTFIERLLEVALEQPSLREQIGQRVANAIKASKLTIAKVATTTGLSEKTIQDLIDGTSRSNPSTLKRISSAIGDMVDFTLDDLLVPRNLEVRATQKTGNLLEGMLEAEANKRSERRGVPPTGLEQLLQTARQWKRSDSPTREGSGEALVEGFFTTFRSRRTAMEVDGSAIRDRRETLGLTVQEAARRACVSHGVWSVLEGGLVDPLKVITSRQLAWSLLWTEADLTEAIADARDAALDALLPSHREQESAASASALSEEAEAPTATASPLPTRDRRWMLDHRDEIIDAFWAAVDGSNLDIKAIRSEYFADAAGTAWTNVERSRSAEDRPNLYGPTLQRMIDAIEGLTAAPLAVGAAPTAQEATETGALDVRVEPDQQVEATTAAAEPAAPTPLGLTTRQRHIATQVTGRLDGIMYAIEDDHSVTFMIPESDGRLFRRVAATELIAIADEARASFFVEATAEYAKLPEHLRPDASDLEREFTTDVVRAIVVEALQRQGIPADVAARFDHTPSNQPTQSLGDIAI